jgi:glutamate-ammonia-ligase adenylyltransferase
MLASANELEEVLDDTRIFAREHQFRIAVRVLKGGLEPEAAGRAFTDIAQSVVAALASVAEAETARRHGRVPGAEWVVLGMGKLGGREMTSSSDLDLVFVYDFDPAHDISTGPQALHATQYFAKLMQRLISLLTVPTREGRLYEVDMRLRPSGHKGPIAVTLERLKTYHESQAWTYEHMALTRARVIAGNAALGARVEAIIGELIVAPRDLVKLSADALDMRARLETAKPGAGPWSLKLARGGLVDLEYIAQTLILALAHQHKSILSPTTATVFERIAAASLLPATEISDLIAATHLLQGLTQVLRIAYDHETSPAHAHRGLKARLAEIGGVPDFPALEAKLVATQGRVRDLFEKYVAALPAQFGS